MRLIHVSQVLATNLAAMKHPTPNRGNASCEELSDSIGIGIRFLLWAPVHNAAAARWTIIAPAIIYFATLNLNMKREVFTQRNLLAQATTAT